MANYEGLTVAVVGATGHVGTKMREILAEREFPVARIVPFASQFSVDHGRTVDWRGKLISVKNATEEDLELYGIDLALLAVKAKDSLDLAPKFVEAGAIVIDNSSAWRQDPKVPLVVPEVNAKAMSEIPKGIIANPNCTTAEAVTVLNPLHVAAELKEVSYTALMAVSGKVRGIDELNKQMRLFHRMFRPEDEVDELAEYLPFDPSVFAAPIAYNIVPQAGELDKNNNDSEENKLIYETRKILNLARLAVSASCIRVPVHVGHSIDIVARFQKAISPDEATEILQSAPGVQLSDLPTPLEAAGKDEVLVGRIRRKMPGRKSLRMFVSGDNLRKGAALNTVQIAELLLPRIMQTK